MTPKSGGSKNLVDSILRVLKLLKSCFGMFFGLFFWSFFGGGFCGLFGGRFRGVLVVVAWDRSGSENSGFA